MALKNILIDISTVLGLDVLSATEQAYHIEKINEAAEEIYNSLDVPGCHREQLFQYNDTDNYQIAFPWYVGKLRAIRQYDSSYNRPISVENLAPRFHNERWGSQGCFKFRITKLNSPLGRSINNAGLFTFTLSHIETADVVINIVGKTVDSGRLSETLTIQAGQIAVTTANSYEEFFNIEKTDYNTYDITITDIDNETMGILSAARLKSNYTIVNIREDDFALVTNNSYPLNTLEILYKHTFTPFRFMYDEFICPNCDKIIFWKYAEHYAAYKPDQEARSLMASAKVAQLLKELNDADNFGKDLQMKFSKNPYYEAQQLLPLSWDTNNGPSYYTP